MRQHFENLAAFFNAAEITPREEGQPAIPRSLWDEDGIWGISYRFNGGNSKWFTVGGLDDENEE